MSSVLCTALVSFKKGYKCAENSLEIYETDSWNEMVVSMEKIAQVNLIFNVI